MNSVVFETSLDERHTKEYITKTRTLPSFMDLTFVTQPLGFMSSRALSLSESHYLKFFQVEHQVQLVVYTRPIKNFKDEHVLNKKHIDAIKAQRYRLFETWSLGQVESENIPQAYGLKSFQFGVFSFHKTCFFKPLHLHIYKVEL